MRGSAPRTPEYRTNLNALPLIGSIRLVGSLSHNRCPLTGSHCVAYYFVIVYINVGHISHTGKLDSFAGCKCFCIPLDRGYGKLTVSSGPGSYGLLAPVCVNGCDCAIGISVIVRGATTSDAECSSTYLAQGPHSLQNQRGENLFPVVSGQRVQPSDRSAGHR